MNQTIDNSGPKHKGLTCVRFPIHFNFEVNWKILPQMTQNLSVNIFFLKDYYFTNSSGFLHNHKKDIHKSEFDSGL